MPPALLFAFDKNFCSEGPQRLFCFERHSVPQNIRVRGSERRKSALAAIISALLKAISEIGGFSLNGSGKVVEIYLDGLFCTNSCSASQFFTPRVFTNALKVSIVCSGPSMSTDFRAVPRIHHQLESLHDNEDERCHRHAKYGA